MTSYRSTDGPSGKKIKNKKVKKQSTGYHVPVAIKLNPQQYNQIRANIDSLQLMHEGV